MIYPAITLYQPWATWIIRGWKSIETRVHNRFASLNGKRILIHAGQKTDSAAIHNPYLTEAQLIHQPDEIINGFILGSAYVENCEFLTDLHSSKALIDCGSALRYGLFLNQVQKFDSPIPVKGEMGIWYYDLTTKSKVAKPKIQSELWPVK